MRLQNSTLCKWHATFGTGNWLFSRVGHFMRFQLTTSQICLVTFATRKWLPTSMDPCMPFRLLPWLCVNGLSQKEQANDFPPVWTFSCVFKEWLWANFFSKMGKGNGFSPVWILSFLFNTPFSGNDLIHFEQANSFSTQLIFSWSSKSLLYKMT